MRYVGQGLAYTLVLVCLIPGCDSSGTSKITGPDLEGLAPLWPPPFSGSIFISPDIIRADDPSVFQSISEAGHGLRDMFDRRLNTWITVDAYLFNATYQDGYEIEVRVNPEFGSTAAALFQAEKYARVVGHLPEVLRKGVRTISIHKGKQLFGGGGDNLLIHTDQGDQYLADGILEEVLVHEAAHASLDAEHSGAPGWLDAQAADPRFISRYAEEYPSREDVAESFLTYLAIRWRPDRISQALADTITEAIPNRIRYFDAQSFSSFPIQPGGE